MHQFGVHEFSRVRLNQYQLGTQMSKTSEQIWVDLSVVQHQAYHKTDSLLYSDTQIKQSLSLSCIKW